MHGAAQSAPHKPLCGGRVVEEANLQGGGALPQVDGLDEGAGAPVPHVDVAAVMP